MEDSNYWLWRRKLDGSPHLPEDNDSWEEQAFAEDSAGDLGGCVWPPKSYSCSFCRREFRSAQALGGHMNVHRRDRARIKLSSEIEDCSHLHHQQHHRQPSPRPPLADRRSSHVGAAAYSSSSTPNGFPGVVASTPSRVSVASTQGNSTEHIFISSSCSSSLDIGNHTGSLLSFPPSCWDQISLRILAVPELILGTDDLKTKERGCAEKKVAGKQDEGEATSTKRRRIDGSIPFIVPSSLGDGSSVRSELLGVGPRPIEELDLELRLGDRPMIK